MIKIMDELEIVRKAKENSIYKWLKRKPMRRWFAKRNLKRLITHFENCQKKWNISHSNQHLADLELMAAKIKWYETAFQAWGKYRQEFCFDENENKKYEAELKKLNIPYDFINYKAEYRGWEE
jgi:hypothetical protein